MPEPEPAPNGALASTIKEGNGLARTVIEAAVKNGAALQMLFICAIAAFALYGLTNTMREMFAIQLAEHRSSMAVQAAENKQSMDKQSADGKAREDAILKHCSERDDKDRQERAKDRQALALITEELTKSREQRVRDLEVMARIAKKLE